MTANLQCQLHKEQIRFICSLDYKPLCPSCIPAHTQHHVTSKQTFLIKDYKQFQMVFREQISLLIDSVSTAKQELENAIDPIQLYEQSNLENFRALLIEHINNVFNEIKQEFIRIVELKVEDGDIDFGEELKKLESTRYELKERYCDKVEIEPHNIEQYFRKKGEYNKVIEEAEEKIESIKQNNSFVPFKLHSKIDDIKQQVSELIFSSISIKNIDPKSEKTTSIRETQRQEKMEIKKDAKVETKAKPKLKASTLKQRKKKCCQFCGQQLQYLTQLKKHLVCKSCGNKERNYVKKG